MSQSKRSPEQIEAEIKQSRAHLNDTMHALEDRLSPRRVKQRAYHYGHHNGINEFFSNLGQEIRQHPLPFLVTGVGLGWLFMSQRKASQQAQRHRANYRTAGQGEALAAARQAAPQRMVATHLGTQQGRANPSQHRPDVVGVATHLGTGQGWNGYVRSA
ncbi:MULTISPECIES: DUF3618 domain-containing protein [Halomonadaceae]|uniref:DUF3618 domain-containing protein n=1 Tax=Halomonadaceae TaxID=28256 RepID=UPI001597A522|nr:MULTISPECIES: DUF3618 domain-containing protein [Halomonas]QJQ96318.1 DUF3618 domain-containing protein [Halomonas sp. PA5]